MVRGNLRQQYEDIYARAMDAVAHWDAVLAWGVYHELEKFLIGLPAGQKQESALAKEIITLKRNLLVVGFPSLPQEEAARLYREHILDFFRVDVDLKERILTRFTFVGYGDKDEERLKLKEAISQNEERLGPFTISAWIELFDSRFRPEKRKEKSTATFLMQTGEVATLQKTEQSVLRQILSVYEECLSREALSDLDMAVIGADVNQGQLSGSVASQSSVSRGAEQKNIISLPLLQALSKYENLGNQLITGERIRVKSQPEPVRPSLLYWLKYYRDELGIGQHSSVERGDFLFRSENGRKLSASERERVNLILKSVEENFPLSVDISRQEIIFPASNAFSITSAGRPAPQDVVLARPDMPTRLDDSPRQARPDEASGQVRSDEAPRRVRTEPIPSAYRGGPAFIVSASAAKSVSESVPAESSRPAFPPSPVRSSYANSPGGVTKTLGTPVFFVPKPEEGEVRQPQSSPQFGEAGSEPASSPSRPYESGGLRIGRGTSFNISKEPTGPLTQAKSVSFSTSHIFPAEKEVAERRVSAPENVAASISQPTFVSASPQPQPVAKKLSPFHIRPVSLGGKDQYEQNQE